MTPARGGAWAALVALSTAACGGGYAERAAGPAAPPSAAAAPVTHGPVDAKTAVAAPAARSPLSGLDERMFLGSIDVVDDPELHGRALILEVRQGEAGPFGELSRRGVATSLGEGRFRVDLPDRYIAAKDAPRAAERACSFVIDCDEPVFSTLAQALRGKEGTTVAARVAALVKLTRDHISKKTLQRGFDIASVVARRREGDCTEHATLLAALARREGLAARVVLGFVLLEWSEKTPSLLGHAWVEVHDGREWITADAALDPESVAQIGGLERMTYLPVQLLSREDAGFHVGLTAQTGIAHVMRARVGSR